MPPRPREGVPVATAARLLGRHPATIRRWIARGAPTVVLGQVGRGRGSRVDPDAILRWRSPAVARRADREVLALIATALWSTLRRDAVHERVGIAERAAAAVLVLAYERCHLDLLREPVGDLASLPEEIRRLCAILTE